MIWRHNNPDTCSKLTWKYFGGKFYSTYLNHQILLSQMTTYSNRQCIGYHSSTADSWISSKFLSLFLYEFQLLLEGLEKVDVNDIPESHCNVLNNLITLTKKQGDVIEMFINIHISNGHYYS